MQDVREIANNPPVDKNLEILMEEQMADFYEDLKERMRIRQEKLKKRKINSEESKKSKRN